VKDCKIWVPVNQETETKKTIQIEIKRNEKKTNGKKRKENNRNEKKRKEIN
jgi:hypothetical protein